MERKSIGTRIFNVVLAVLLVFLAVPLGTFQSSAADAIAFEVIEFTIDGVDATSVSSISGGEHVVLRFKGTVNNALLTAGQLNFSCPLGQTNIQLDSSGEVALNDEFGEFLGTISITDGTVNLTLDSDYVSRHSNISFKGESKGKITVVKTGDPNQKANVGFANVTGALVQNIPVVTVSDLDVQKWTNGNVYLEGGKYYQKYTIKVTANGDVPITNIHIEDIATGLGDITGATFPVDIASLAPGEEKTYNYTQEIPKSSITAGTGSNKAKVTFNKNGVPAEKITPEVKYNYNTNASIGKSGTADNTTGEITWKVQVRHSFFTGDKAQDKALLSGDTFTDTLGAGQTDTGSIFAGGAAVSADTYIDNATFVSGWLPYYEYTYKTTFTPSASAVKKYYKNSVSGTIEGKHVQTGDVSVEVVGIPTSVNKEAVGKVSSDGYMQWKVTYEVKTPLYSLELRDNVGNKHKPVVDDPAYPIILKVNGSEIADYTKDSNMGEWSNLNIKLNNAGSLAVGDKIELTFFTKANNFTGAAETYPNNVSVVIKETADGDEVSVSDNAEHKVDVVEGIKDKKSDGSLGKLPKSKWTIVLNGSELSSAAVGQVIEISDRMVASNKWAGSVTDLNSWTASDKLDLGAKITDAALYCDGSPLTTPVGMSSNTVTGELRTTFTVTITPELAGLFAANKNVDLVYNAEYDPEKFYVEGWSSCNIWNYADMKLDGSVGNNVLRWEYKDRNVSDMLKKDYIYSTDSSQNVVKYEIIANNSGAVLGGDISIKDTLGSCLTLLKNETYPLKVEVGYGTEYTAYTFTENSAHSFTISGLPDGQRIKITYYAKIVGKQAGDVLTDEEGGNRVELLYGSDTAANVFKESFGVVLESKFSGTGNNLSINIRKFYKNTSGLSVKLSGAEFTFAPVEFVDGAVTDIPMDPGLYPTITSSPYTGADGQLTNTAVGFKNDVVYKVTETVVPDGFAIGGDFPEYIIFKSVGNTTNYPGVESLISDDKLEIENVPDTAKLPSVVTFSKKNVGGEELAGAKLSIIGADFTAADITAVYGTGASEISKNNVSLTYISGKTPTVIKGLPAGTYKLHEEAAPEGYLKTTDITFVITDGGKVLVNGSEVTAVTMVDKAEGVTVVSSTVTLSKTDVGGNELAGAKITVSGADFTRSDITVTYGENGSGVSKTGTSLTYISGTTPTVIKGLPAGNYIMHEEAAPEGYLVATDIAFTVTADGKVLVGGNEVNSITMVDEAKPTVTEPNTVTLSKKNVGGNELAGAKITVSGTDFTSEAVKVEVGTGASVVTKNGTSLTYISGTIPTVIKGLPAGNYIMHEEAAPEGYLVATDIAFTVTADGKVLVGGNEVNSVTMVDEAKPEDTVPFAVTLSKKNVGGTELAGAKIIVSGADFTSSDVKVELGTGASVVTKNGTSLTYISGTIPTVIKGLPAGNYTMHEDAAPEGYLVATDIAFTVTADGKVLVGGNEVNSVTMVDEAKIISTVTLSKTDVGGNELSGAKITINGVNLKNQNVDIQLGEGASLVADARYYITYISGTTPTVIKGLSAGDYTMHEEAAPDGYLVASDISFTVTDDGKVLVGGSEVNAVTMVDEAKSDGPAPSRVILSKRSFGDEELAGAKIVVSGTDFTSNDIRIRLGSGASLVSKDSTSMTYISGRTPTVIEGLPAGEYTMHEEAAPEGYLVATDIKFTVTSSKNVLVDGIKTSSVIMFDKADDNYKPGDEPEDKPGDEPEDKPDDVPEDKPDEEHEDKPGKLPTPSGDGTSVIYKPLPETEPVEDTEDVSSGAGAEDISEAVEAEPVAALVIAAVVLAAGTAFVLIRRRIRK